MEKRAIPIIASILLIIAITLIVMSVRSNFLKETLKPSTSSNSDHVYSGPPKPDPSSTVRWAHSP